VTVWFVRLVVAFSATAGFASPATMVGDD